MTNFLHDNWTVLIWLFVGFTYLILALTGKLPSVYNFKHALSSLNDRGGNIAVLSLFSIWFFYSGMRLFYVAFKMISENKLDEKSAVLLMALQWVTGVCFGGAFGALLKSMTGSDSLNMRAGDPERPDRVNGNGKVAASIPPEEGKETK